MNAIKQLREKLGLNQEEMAKWLDISRSLLANFERGERSLPTPALLQMAPMETALNDMQQKSATAKASRPIDGESQKRHAVVRQEFERHAENCRNKAEKMRKKLKEIQIIHVQTLQLKELTGRLIAENPNEKKNNRQFQWLQANQTLAVRRLKTCDEAAQLKMKVKIESMEAMAKIHEKSYELLV